MSSGGTVKTGKRVSIASKDVLDIQPVVYSFKGPPQTSSGVVTAARPPQWLYHDHVMGVIWMIFHKEKNYVGISQLQWCLKFLLDLKNSRGEYTADIEICIQAIQDDLVEQYAKLGPAIEKLIIAEKSFDNEERTTDVSEFTQNPMNDRTVEEDVTTETNLYDTTLTVNDDSTDFTNNNAEESGEGNKHDSFMDGLGQGIAGTSTPKKEQSKTTNRENQNRSKNADVHCSLKCKTKEPPGKKKKEVRSFTYDEMMSRGPLPCTQPYLVEDAFDDQSIEHSQERQDISANMNTSDLVTFLNSTRQQHVERINNELATLRILERLLENLNITGFSGNDGEHTMRELGNERSEHNNEENEESSKIND